MKRRAFLGSAAALAAQTAAPRRTAFELEELSISDLAVGMAQGRWTSQRLVEMYLGRINAIDRNGPRLGAAIELNPDAASIAEQLDRERKQGRVRGALHGIPVLVKDNIDTADKMSTTAGSLALDGWHPPQDSFVAARLRAAGAVILGKTNLSEWANFRSAHSVSGWSGRGGQTRCPYALHRNPSGSSSGSGAAVAASLCAVAIGTETDGSVVSPSSINGLVGVKPTVGLISRAGIIPISSSQDTAGPMARTVRDAAILLSALTGVDPNDPATVASQGNTQPDYLKFLDPGGLRGARLGIARKFFARNAEMDAFLNQCIDALKHGGAEIVDPADLPSHGKWDSPENPVLLYEFKAGINAYLARLPAKRHPRTLAEIIDFNEKNRAREMPYFGQEVFIDSETKTPTEEKYRDARKDCIRFTRTEGIDAVMDANKLDAIVTLTNGPACLIDWVGGDSDTGGCSSPPAIAGYPHVTVPAGLYRGLPIGLSFFGKAWSEAVLLRLAFAYENATKARRKPKFLDGCEIPAQS